MEKDRKYVVPTIAEGNNYPSTPMTSDEMRACLPGDPACQFHAITYEEAREAILRHCRVSRDQLRELLNYAEKGA